MMPTNGGANASAWAWAGLAVSAHQHKAGRRVIIASFGLQLLLFQRYFSLLKVAVFIW